MMKIVCLGPKGSFSDVVAREWAKKEVEIEIQYKDTINDVFNEFQTLKKNGISAIGIMPIENSIEGSVANTVDRLIELDGVIIGEVILNIRQNLLSINEIELSDIKIIYSHPQAFAQTRGWIQKNCPQTTLIEVGSTSGAAERVRIENIPERVAIASVEAATFFGLKALRKSINDFPNNQTRFIVLGHGKTPITERDKTSLVFSVENKPGSLLKVLEIFDVYNVNILKLESRPTKKKLGLYHFFVDIEGHQHQESIRNALALLKKKGGVKILGSYPASVLKKKVKKIKEDVK
ncbi:MAG: prephenate dehydratase [Candidatus Desantisbacteria bacterium]